MIKKLPDGRWEYRGDTYDAATGRRRQLRRRFARKADALAFERRQLVDGPSAPARDVPVFRDYAKEWLKVHSVSQSLSPSTRRVYGVAIRDLSDSIGDVRMSRLTPARLEPVVSDLADRHSRRTLRLYLNVLRMICARAVRDGHLSRDPVALVERPRAASDPERPSVTPEALRAVLASVFGTPCHLPIYLMAVTGMRVSECLGLCWDSVDLDAGTLTVRRQRVPSAANPDSGLPLVPGTFTVLMDHTKTRQVRTVSLPPAAVEILREARRAQVAAGVLSPYVVTDGTVPMSHHKLARSLEPFGLHPHALRHAHASLLLAAGIPLPEVSRRLGHASPSVTVSTYLHSVVTQDARAATAIDSVLNPPADDTKDDTGPTS